MDYKIDDPLKLINKLLKMF